MSKVALVVLLLAGTASAQSLVVVADAGAPSMTLERPLQAQGGSTQDIAEPYLWVGGSEWSWNGDIFGIGFGYHDGPGQAPAVVVGEKMEFAAGNTIGSFFVATRATAGANDKPLKRLTVTSQGKVILGTSADGGTPADDGTAALVQVGGYISSEGQPVPTVIDPHYSPGRPQVFTYGVETAFDSEGHAVIYFSDIGYHGYGLGGGYCWFQYYHNDGDNAFLLQITYGNFYETVHGQAMSPGFEAVGTPGRHFLWTCVGADFEDEE